MNITEYDDEGIVFGHPDQVELDIIITKRLSGIKGIANLEIGIANFLQNDRRRNGSYN